MKTFSKILVVVLGLAFALGLVGPIPALAATSPTLGESSSYSVLAGSTVTNVGSTTTNGAVGVSPGTAITNFPPGIAGGGLQSNNASAIAAQADNLSAFGDLDQACDHTYGAQDLTLLSPLSPGVYCSTSSFSLTGNLTLTGSGVWIFKTVSTLITSPGSSITGGDPCSVWWRVGSSATLDTTTAFIGSILALTDINMYTGATLNGRAMAQTGQVVLQGNTISGPVCTVVPPTAGGSTQIGTINVVKTVINDNGGIKTVADFPLFVSGQRVTSGENNAFTTSPTHAVTETADPNYTQTFSGDCDATGHINLGPGDIKFCIVTNNDIGPAVVAPPVPPLIAVVKVPNPLALPAGPGAVTYTYTLRNIGTVPVTDVTMIGDTCSPITLASGDTNTDAILQVSETWTYTCSTTLSETHTNTVVATGWANGLSAVDIASATVVVGLPTVPPLIHVTKIPSPLTLSAGGGMVTYTERITNPGTVALSDVILSDDKCSPMNYISGDTNSDSKLDVTETWVYTCRMNLSNTTTNTAIAVGQANGFSVRDFAVATVTVATAVPALPSTGLSPEGKSIPWDIVILSGIFMLAAISFVVVLKKSTI
ncbi:MAG: ice-binding family protein [Patescibacteria group bacterium]